MLQVKYNIDRRAIERPELKQEEAQEPADIEGYTVEDVQTLQGTKNRDGYNWKKVMTGKEVGKVLEQNGWEFVRQKGTSHMIYQKRGHHVSIPDHKELKKGTFKRIKNIITEADEKSKR